MDAYEADEVLARADGHGERYLEIARGRTASVGVYTLAAGAVDPQGVHDADEVYHVLAGRARLRVDHEDRPVGPGSIVYVHAGVPHGFHATEQDLRVLVFFAEAGAPVRLAPVETARVRVPVAVAAGPAAPGADGSSAAG